MTELQLPNLTDDELQEILDEIQSELAERDAKKKAEATEHIKALADAAGLSVAVKNKTATKRGRPRKQKQKKSEPTKEES